MDNNNNNNTIDVVFARYGAVICTSDFRYWTCRGESLTLAVIHRPRYDDSNNKSELKGGFL